MPTPELLTSGDCTQGWHHPPPHSIAGILLGVVSVPVRLWAFAAVIVVEECRRFFVFADEPS